MGGQVPRRRAWIDCVGRAGVILSALGMFTAVPRAEVIDRVLAVVAGQVITLSDVRAVSELALLVGSNAPDALRGTLDQLIERELILTEVRRYAPPQSTPDPARIVTVVAAPAIAQP